MLYSLDQWLRNLAATTGQAHRSTPAKFTAHVLMGHLDVTASLTQAHARWLTTPHVSLEFVGLEHDWMPVSGTVDLPAELGRFLSELADTAEFAHAVQVAAYLSRREGVRP